MFSALTEVEGGKNFVNGGDRHDRRLTKSNPGISACGLSLAFAKLLTLHATRQRNSTSHVHQWANGTPYNSEKLPSHGQSTANVRAQSEVDRRCFHREMAVPQTARFRGVLSCPCFFLELCFYEFYEFFIQL